MRPLVPFLALVLCFPLASGLLLADDEPVPKPAPAPHSVSAERIQGLIDQLGANDFDVRQRASRELLSIGEPARKALEHTQLHSEDMEARWRAEQILRRLDQERGRPLGAPAEKPRPPAPRVQVLRALEPRAPGGRDPNRVIEEMLKNHEEFRRMLDERMSVFGFGFPEDRHELVAPGLVLEISTFGVLPRVHLRVTTENGETPYLGRGLEDVLRRYPDLDRHPGMGELKSKWQEFKKQRPARFPFDRRMPFGGTSFRFGRSGKSIDISQVPDGVHVKITETDKDGNASTKEYQGESLDQLKRDHPELEEQLGGLSIQVGPTQLFRHRFKGPFEPLPSEPRAAPPVTPREREPVYFGLELHKPDLVLAAQLGLEPGHGAVVQQVMAGSQAQAMGFERFDVIVAVDGRPVGTYADVLEAVRKAGRERVTPLAIEVVRKGSRLTLAR